MKQTVDLHMHSSASLDGELSPEALVFKCAQAGLHTIALTDHNTVRNVSRAKLAARLHGIRVVSGIEMDCVFLGQPMHLLGYGIQEGNSLFSELEESIAEQERHAGGLRIELLRKCGIQMDGAWLCTHAKNGIMIGELIAEAALNDSANIRNPLMKPYYPGGTRSDNPTLNFYQDYFAYGRPAYVPIRYMQAGEAIALIHSCGGVAVLAHPGATFGQNGATVHGLIQLGVDGIEVFSNYHTEEQMAYYEKLACTKQLLQACGSDFHGKIKPTIEVGDVPCKDTAAAASGLLGQCS